MAAPEINDVFNYPWDIRNSVTRIVKMIDIDLYERALDLVVEMHTELEELSGAEVYVDLPPELGRAWKEREALAAVMSEVCEEGGEDVRQRLETLYRERLVDADEYHEEIIGSGPEMRDNLWAKIETLIEEDRRARILDS